MLRRSFLISTLLLSLLLPEVVAAVGGVGDGREEVSDEQMLEMLLKDGGPPQSAELAVATYYASRFAGRRTSSGQRYNPERYTAAHAELPLGSSVTVESLKTGRQVTVLINDRCRKRDFQLIDLSKVAAMQIGLWGKGAVKVRIRPVAKGDLLDELLLDQ